MLKYQRKLYSAGVAQLSTSKTLWDNEASQGHEFSQLRKWLHN